MSFTTAHYGRSFRMMKMLRMMNMTTSNIVGVPLSKSTVAGRGDPYPHQVSEQRASLLWVRARGGVYPSTPASTRIG